MIEDKLVSCSFWVGEVASSNLAYHIVRSTINIKGVMAEWLLRSTVNTFFQGFDPL